MSSASNPSLEDELSRVTSQLVVTQEGLRDSGEGRKMTPEHLMSDEARRDVEQ